MSTGGLVSCPMTLKIGMELDVMLLHRPLLAFRPPVPGFCAASFLSISDQLGFASTTRHWRKPCFGEMVDA